MFRLEKVFQNDDYGYYLYINFIKSITLFASVYIFSILKNNSIYEIFVFEIFRNSQYFYYSLSLSILFFLVSFNFKNKEYQRNFISFLKEDILNIIISNLLLFSIFFVLKLNFEIDITTL